MEHFRRRYHHFCRHGRCEINETLMRCLSTSKENVLDFSNCNMSDEDCRVLGKCLAEDKHYSIVHFTDCLLTESCCQTLIKYLSANKIIHKIDFKGNNIRLNGAEEINRLLKLTAHLTVLSLEWNALGMWEMGVKAIAEGLSLNQTLLHLDLRNNQISHESVCDLSSALRKNNTLRTLDLRWNNAGIIGARALVGTLKQNKTLIQLKLEGNNVPGDILQTIQTALSRNADQHLISERHDKMTCNMKNEVAAIEESKRIQISKLNAQLSQERQLQDSLNMSTYEKIESLKAVLEDRRAVAEKLSDRCKKLEKSLDVANQTLSEKEQEYNSLFTKSQGTQGNLDKTINQLREKCLNLEQEVLDASKQNEKSNLELKLRCSQLQSDVDVKNSEVATLQNQIKKLESEHGKQIEMIENQYHKDRDFFRNSSEEKISELQAKVTRFEKDLHDRDANLDRLRSTLTAEKLRYDEDIIKMKNKIREEESSKIKQLEDKIAQLQQAKDEIQAKLTLHVTENSDLKSQLANKINELLSTSRNVDSCKHELNQLQQIHKHEVDRLKHDFDNEKRLNLESKTKLALSEGTIKELNDKLSSLKSDKDSEIERLQKQLYNKDNEILNLREEEMRRAGMLQSAFQNYIGSRSPIK